MTRCGIEDFKMKLDNFLENVPDNMRGLVPGACTAVARPSNSIIDQVKMVFAELNLFQKLAKTKVF